MLLKFPRGVRLEQKKSPKWNGQIQTFPTVDVIVLPLLGVKSLEECRVREGDYVAKFASLTAAKNAPTTHSPVSGMVKQIKSIAHPLLGEVLCAVIDTEKKGKEPKTKPFSGGNDILAAVQAAGIIDELDSVPLYQKLEAFQRDKIDVLVVNALDEEPYLANAENVLQQYTEEILSGIDAAAKACGAKEQKIAVHSVQHIKNAETFKKKPSAQMLLKVGRVYPAWPNLEEKLKHEGKGAGQIGVQACAALGCTLKKGMPQTETIVTVAGEGIENPTVFRVAIGTPIKDILDACGQKEDANLVIMGSPLTGQAAEYLDTPVVVSTRCLIVQGGHHKHKNFACIGCGKCTKVCPEGIMPWYIYERINCKKVDTAKLLRAESCCHCNACSIVCPSGIRLADAVKQAAAMKEEGGDMQ